MKNVLKNVCPPYLRDALEGPVLLDLRRHAGAAQLDQIDSNIRVPLFNEVAAIIRPPLEKLMEARQTYIERRRKSAHPLGIWRERKWFPDSLEHRECCDQVRQPTMTYPYSLMRHCRTLKHISNLYGVPVSDLRWAARGYQRKDWVGWRKPWEEKKNKRMAKEAAMTSEKTTLRREKRWAQEEATNALVESIKAEFNTIRWEIAQEDFQI